MYWEKEIRFKLTTRRIFSGIIAAMSVLNLAVVGAVFNASSQTTTETDTASMTSIPTQETLTGVFPTNTLAMNSLIPEFTSVITHTASPTLISTFTPTDTSTAVPAATTCARRSYWPVYRVQRGDILIAIAQATGSTVRELMEANCLPDTRIYAGQLLYVPRLPIYTFTLTPSVTPSITPTATLTNTQTAAVTDTPSATPTSFTDYCNWAQVVTDVTIPTGTIMFPGEEFTKTWRLRNVGSCVWSTYYQLVFYSGDPMSVPSPKNLPSNVSPGQSVDISMDMTAPLKYGSYQGNWMLSDANGALFGTGAQANEPWPVMINVSGPTVIPDDPTVFQNPSGSVSLCYYPYVIDFSILPSDPQGIKSVNVVYNINDGVWNEISMTTDGSIYKVSVTIRDQINIAYYRFNATDGSGNSKDSGVYKVTLLTNCPRG